MIQRRMPMPEDDTQPPNKAGSPRQAQNPLPLTGELIVIPGQTGVDPGRHAKARNLVKIHAATGMAVGLIPFPLIDMTALSEVQANLLRSLCKHYGIDFNADTGKIMLSALVGGSLPVAAALGLGSFAKLIPGIGTIGGGISMVVLAGATVYATGQVLIHHFEAGGTLRDFNGKHWQVYFREQFEEGKAFVKATRTRW
jgi:uncharacterized protein (DUF697 family)